MAASRYLDLLDIKVREMPQAHRNTDSRKCGASTIVVNQSSVFVNRLLWAVDGDPNTHGAGHLKAVTGGPSVFIEGKPVICAVGDTCYDADNEDHSPGEDDPNGHSPDVYVY